MTIQRAHSPSFSASSWPVSVIQEQPVGFLESIQQHLRAGPSTGHMHAATDEHFRELSYPYCFLPDILCCFPFLKILVFSQEFFCLFVLFFLTALSDSFSSCKKVMAVHGSPCLSAALAPYRLRRKSELDVSWVRVKLAVSLGHWRLGKPYQAFPQCRCTHFSAARSARKYGTHADSSRLVLLSLQGDGDSPAHRHSWATQTPSILSKDSLPSSCSSVPFPKKNKKIKKVQSKQYPEHFSKPKSSCSP